ncbi:hypothetical protein RJ55_03564 [Drechmeria coniospora]|nr:hypothetical protein RJ55_03564 [Drechmeria coniospora]
MAKPKSRADNPTDHSSAYSDASYPEVDVQQSTTPPVSLSPDSTAIVESAFQDSTFQNQFHRQPPINITQRNQECEKSATPSARDTQLQNLNGATSTIEGQDDSQDSRVAELQETPSILDSPSSLDSVRPESQFYVALHHSIFSDISARNSRLAYTKVAPFDPALEHTAQGPNTTRAEGEFVSQSPTTLDITIEEGGSVARTSNHSSRPPSARRYQYRLPEVEAPVDGRQLDALAEGITPSSSAFEFPKSKIRPHIFESDYHGYPGQSIQYGPKVKPMLQPESTGSELKPCSPTSGANFGSAAPPMYRHLPKVQPFSGQSLSVPVPSPLSLDQCTAAEVPEMECVGDVEEYPATEPTNNIYFEGQNSDAASRVLDAHAPSRCQEYPTSAKPEPHTIETYHGRMHSASSPNREVTPYGVAERSSRCAETLYDSGPVRSPPRPIDDAGSPSRRSSHRIDTATKAVHDAVSSGEGLKGSGAFGDVRTQSRRRSFVHSSTPTSKIHSCCEDDVAPDEQGTRTLASMTTDAKGGLPPEIRSHRSSVADSPINRKAATENSQGPTSSQRTAQWLRGVLGQPDPYTTKFTKRPDKRQDETQASPDQVPRSESLVSSFLASCHLPRRGCEHSVKSKLTFDGHDLKSAVGDLERLLNEALNIASHVIERPDATTALPRTFEPDPSLHSDRHSGDGEYSCQLDPSPTSAPGSAEDPQRAAGMVTISSDKSSLPKSPRCPRATTQSGYRGRPRRNGIIQTYSGQGGEKDTGKTDRDDRQLRVSPGNLQVSFDIPRRKTCTNVAGCLDLSEDGLRRSKHAPAECAGGRGRLGDDPLIPVELAPQLGPGSISQYGRDVPGKIGRMGQGSVPEPRPGSGCDAGLPQRDGATRPAHTNHGINLRRKSHVSLHGVSGFSLAKSRKRQATARDWSPIRKRFVAAVACISTALIGVILGIYAGLVPSIQYYIIDQSHATVHGNTGCFLGLALPTFFLWPLPLLHGRKPYIMSSLVLAMPLLFPQALAVNSQRLTDTVSWRIMLLASRAAMGFSLGFANQDDARRHGGGMGVWLGIWTWCWIGSLGVGFLVGACLIDQYPPAWGFYVSIIILAVVLFLNIVSPESRRSAFRRSVVEVRTGTDISRRVARGEVTMHRVKTGPRWWGQEVYHGIALSLEMLRQPGFAVLALYAAWIYAQVVLIIVLLGSLTSRFYKLRSPVVGLLVGSMALGAILAIPFQKGNLFSRSRLAQMNTNLATLNRKVAWSSHLVRRTVFTLLLPLAGICYASVSAGPPMHISAPTIFATLVGFLSCLAIAECNGLVMETFDTSDLSPGMVGRQKGGDGKLEKRTNYSSFPRVTSGFAIIHSLAFVLAAGATALGGLVTRTLGQQVSTGVVAGVLLILTLLLLLVLIRFADVQIVPKCRSDEMDRIVEVRRRSSTRRVSMPDDPQAVLDEERAWRPAMIGNPTGKKRRMNILELGGQSRWQTIRQKNKLIDEGAHLNREAWEQGIEALDDQMSDLQRDARELFGMSGVGRSSTRGGRAEEEDHAAGESIEMNGIAPQSNQGGHSGRGRYAERTCAMSESGRDGSGDGMQATRRRR